MTGEDLERCLTSFAKSISANLGRPLRVDWFEAAIAHLKTYAIISYEGFEKLSKREELSLRSCIIALKADNVLTTEDLREKTTATLPISIMLTERYLHKTVLDAARGSMPTTRLICVWGLVVVLVSTGARGGDITLNNLYIKEGAWQFLKYSDVQIYVDSDTKLQAQVILRAVKGAKDTQTKKNHTIVFNSDLSTFQADFFMDPILAIIVIAVRSGNLLGGSLEDVIASCLQSSTQIIPWIHPDRPIFHAFTPRLESLVDKPMSCTSTIRSVEKFVATTGVDMRITPYSFRRGHANDVMNLKGLPDYNERHVAAAISHSHGTIQTGATELYSGKPRIDYFGARREQAASLVDELNPLAIKLRANSKRPSSEAQDVTPSKRPRPLSTLDTPIGTRQIEPVTPAFSGFSVDEEASSSEEFMDEDYENGDFDYVDEGDNEGDDDDETALAWLIAEGDANEILEELPILENKKLQEFRSASEFVNFMIKLPNVYEHSKFSNGTLYDDAPGFVKNDDETYRCTTCYRDVKSLSKHRGDCHIAFDPNFWGPVIMDHHGTPSFTCKACHRNFQWTINRRTGICGHNKSCPERTESTAATEHTFQCPYCPRLFPKNQPKRLETHIQTVHQGQEIPPEVDSTVLFPFVCTQGCVDGKFSDPKRFKTQRGLTAHNDVNHRG